MASSTTDKETAAPIRVLALGTAPGFLSVVRAALEAEPGVQLSLREEGVEALGRAQGLNSPDVLIVHEATKSPNHFAILAQYSQRHPGVAIVLSSASKDADQMVQALRAGVKEFLFEPFVEGEIAAVVSRLGVRKTAQPPVKQGEVMAFLPCKGGSGSTFLATNLAHVLASRHHKKVLLIDLNLQFGDASFFLLDRPPPTSLAGVCGSFARLDQSFLTSAVAKLPSGLHLLAAPEHAADAELVKPEHIEAIVGLARGQYDFIVLDVSRSLDAVSLKALDLADHVYPVLQLSLPYVRDARRMKEVFHSLGYSESLAYSKNKIRWVVNRSGGEGDFPVADMNKVVGPAFWSVPNDHKHVGEAVNQGVPVIELASHSPSAKSLIKWAEALTSGEVEETKPRKHWFSLLRGSGK